MFCYMCLTDCEQLYKTKGEEIVLCKSCLAEARSYFIVKCEKCSAVGMLDKTSANERLLKRGGINWNEKAEVVIFHTNSCCNCVGTGWA